MKQLWDRMCLLGVPKLARGIDLEHHRLSNAFVFLILLMAIIYNPIYLLMGAWKLWIFSCSLILFVSISIWFVDACSTLCLRVMAR